jgi:hypothetical protein
VKWVLLWVLLVLLAVAVLGWLAWGVFRKVLALGAELGRSAAHVGPVLDQIHEPYVPASSVLSDPTIAPQVRPHQAGDRQTRAGHRRFGSGGR